MGRRSLQSQFLFLLFILLVAGFVAITSILVEENSSTLRTNLIEKSKSFAALSTKAIGQSFVLYQDSGTIRIQQQVDQYTSLDPDINQVEVASTNGKILFVDNTKSATIHASTDSLSGLSEGYIYDSHHNLVGIVEPYLEDYGIHRYSIVYGISYSSITQSIHRAIVLTLLISSFAMLAYLLIWYFLFNRLFLEPIANVSELALLISNGDLEKQIRLNRNDEISDLANAVNTMASSLKADIAKVEELDKLKSEFMLITSHNLRTPLAIIEGYLEQIHSQKPSPEILSNIEPIDVSIKRLKGLSEDVLTISTIEAGENVLNLKPTAIEPLIEKVAKDFAPMAEEKQLKFHTDIKTDAWVNLSPPRFQSALWNLLDNAYKFTDSGGAIDLIVRKIDQKLTITVRDTGAGITSSEMPKLFIKFHHATNALTGNFDGLGIGLYITKLIIERHDGTIHVDSTEGKGTTFTITLPIVPAEEIHKITPTPINHD